MEINFADVFEKATFFGLAIGSTALLTGYGFNMLLKTFKSIANK